MDDMFRGIRDVRVWSGRGYDLLTSADAERRHPDPLIRAFHEADIFLPDERPYRVDDYLWEFDAFYMMSTEGVRA